MQNIQYLKFRIQNLKTKIKLKTLNPKDIIQNPSISILYFNNENFLTLLYLFLSFNINLSIQYLYYTMINLHVSRIVCYISHFQLLALTEND